MKVTSVIDVYEENGTDTKGLDRPKVKIHSHWNWSDFVVLEVTPNETVTVSASELIAAIQNAGNKR